MEILARDTWANTLGDILGIVLMLLIVSIFPIVGAAIGKPRGRTSEGAILGFIAPIGWLITAFLPRTPEAEAIHQLRVLEYQKKVQAQLGMLSPGTAPAVQSAPPPPPPPDPAVLARIAQKQQEEAERRKQQEESADRKVRKAKADAERTAYEKRKNARKKMKVECSNCGSILHWPDGNVPEVGAVTKCPGCGDDLVLEN